MDNHLLAHSWHSTACQTTRKASSVQVWSLHKTHDRLIADQVADRFDPRSPPVQVSSDRTPGTVDPARDPSCTAATFARSFATLAAWRTSPPTPTRPRCPHRAPNVPTTTAAGPLKPRGPTAQRSPLSTAAPLGTFGPITGQPTRRWRTVLCPHAEGDVAAQSHAPPTLPNEVVIGSPRPAQRQQPPSDGR